MVGERSTTSEFAVKSLEAVALVSGGEAVERIVTLSTPADSEARARLESYVESHADCVLSGFSARACEQ